MKRDRERSQGQDPMKMLRLVVLAGVLAGCAGGDDAGEKSGKQSDPADMPPAPTGVLSSPDTTSPPPVPPSEAVWVKVKGDTLEISNSYLRTGEVRIAILNEDRQAHTIEIHSGRARWRTIPIQPGKEAILGVSLDPTDHDVYCVEPGHREKGERLKFKAVSEQD